MFINMRKNEKILDKTMGKKMNSENKLNGHSKLRDIPGNLRFLLSKMQTSQKLRENYGKPIIFLIIIVKLMYVIL